MNRHPTALTALALTSALALGACAPMAQHSTGMANGPMQPPHSMQGMQGMQGMPATHHAGSTAMHMQMQMQMQAMKNQSMLPAAVQVPAGQQVAMDTVGTGTITYACKAKKGDATAYEWTFMGPDAQLSNRQGQRVGRYYGPPATWESTDGSKVTATQLAVAPAGAGNIPMQLVRANPAMGQGAMQGVTYIQRLAVQGGAAPMALCNASTAGQQQTVNYQADYTFWRAAPALSVEDNPLYSQG